MAERTIKRPAGVTRVKQAKVTDPAERLATAALSGFTREQLERVALDRGLSAAGTDAELRTRILNDMGA